jgi:hypothetical protein
MSLHKIPNSSTSATSFNYPNTIMLRDINGASRVSSLIMKGSDFVKECISSSTILTKGYLYFSNNTNNNGYALFRNVETNENHIHLSLDFGQNNKCGNFSIRTHEQTNFIVRNNKIGINKPNPAATLDVSGTVLVSSTTTINGPLIANNSLQITDLSQGGPVYANSTGQLYIPEMRQINKPFHIVDASAVIPFTAYKIFVIEIPIKIHLPVNVYDGYGMTIINKSGESVLITTSDNMFNVFYLPNGGTQFSLDGHHKMELTYCQTSANNSWIF